MTAEPEYGWGKDGIYRVAHMKALKGDYRMCLSAKEESEKYEKLYRQEINRIISRGQKYEEVKAKGREKRRLEREAKARLALEQAMEREKAQEEARVRIANEVSLIAQSNADESIVR